MTSIPPETIREFVTASHFNLPKVQEMLSANPDLLTVSFDWGPEGGLENGIEAAAHVGNRPIAVFFTEKGLPSTICVEAMLGNIERVRGYLADDPDLANARGAHGITLMFHAALSGSLPLVEMLKAAGCKEGYSHALHAAVGGQDNPMVAWLLENGATNVNMLDYQGKTPLDHAEAAEMTETVTLLKERGAQHAADLPAKPDA